jgi:uncharacterized protein
MISRSLIESILCRYALPRDGIHGLSHWARVLENGRKLSEMTCARTRVVELFAVFHDSQRINEAIDEDHGRRGAILATELRGRAYELKDEDFVLLIQACELHTDGLREGDVTLQTCWDADRLDLWRVGIFPQHDRLCTDPARIPSLLKWAVDRSERRVVPTSILGEWGIHE